MERRAVLKALAAWPAVASSLAHARTPPPGAISQVRTVSSDDVAKPRVGFFSDAEFSALRHLSGLLYPPFQGYPGAVECGVPEFLDFLLSQSSADQQQLYRGGLDQLNSRSRKPFGELTAAEADVILKPLHDPWTYHPPQDPFARFLREVKDDVITATENSHPWLAFDSKRSGWTKGVHAYWKDVQHA